MARQAKLPAFAQFDWALRLNVRKLFIYFISVDSSFTHRPLGVQKWRKHLFGADGVGQRRFQLLEHDSKAQLPFVYPLGLYT